MSAEESIQLVSLPKTIAGYIWRTTRRDQILLSLLAIIVFLLNTAPLELQRRIVNDAFKNGDLRSIMLLSLAYAGLALVEGAVKLLLNVYCAWVSENTSRSLRKAIYRLLSSVPRGRKNDSHEGVEISMIIDEVDDIGGFVGISVSQPVLQVGILISVVGYMVFLQPLMAFLTVIIVLPQLIFVPLMQGAINRRAKSRIQTLRSVSSSIVADHAGVPPSVDEQDARIQRVFAFNMGIFKLKFSMNFLMNLGHHICIAAVFALGGWFAVNGSIQVGTIVAFVSGVAKANDPWGETVNWYREMMMVSVKYRLISDTVAALTTGGAQPPPAEAVAVEQPDR